MDEVLTKEKMFWAARKMLDNAELGDIFWEDEDTKFIAYYDEWENIMVCKLLPFWLEYPEHQYFNEYRDEFEQAMLAALEAADIVDVSIYYGCIQFKVVAPNRAVIRMATGINREE